MLNIYTPDMVKVGVIADYESLIYSPHFYEVGTFEMYININKQYTEELKMNNIIQINDNEEKTMFITHRSLPLNDSGRSGETLFIKGYTLDGLTTRRNIVTDNEKAFMNFEGSQEYIMKQFVYKNMINADDKGRNIPGLKLSNNKNLGKQDRWRGRQEKVSDKITEIGLYAELGWNILFDSHKKEFIFDVKKGVNRQLNNGVRSPVLFELSFGNVLSREFTEDITNSANVIYVGGNGELEEKLIQKVGNTSGFPRIEVYQEHSTVDNVKELTTIGEQTLKELEKTENFNTIVSPRGSYIYEEDYFLGDYITIIDKQLNIRVNTQITGVKEINEGLGGVEITFGKMIPTIFNTMATNEKARILDIPDKASGENGKPGEEGKPGQDGIGLNYHWNGTKLGIKREDDSDYSYMDLIGKPGIQGVQGIPGKNGSDATVTKGKVVEVLGYTPLEKVAWTDVNNKPSKFKPEEHDHNDNYYLKYLVDNMLNGKQNLMSIGTYAKKAEDPPSDYPSHSIKYMFGRREDGWPYNYCGVITYQHHISGANSATQVAFEYQNRQTPMGSIKVRMSTYATDSWGEWFNLIFDNDLEKLSLKSHTHDNYETSISNLELQKADNKDLNVLADKLQKDLDLKLEQNDLKWVDIVGKPNTFTPSSHNHDTNYYKKTEIDTKISNFITEVTWSEVTGKPTSFKPSSHSHSEYATNTKVNELETKLNDLDIPEGVDLKPVYTKINDLDNKKADKTIKDEESNNEYEIIIKNGRPFLKVVK